MIQYITEWGTVGVHDPTVIKDRETQKYYMFSTDTPMNGTFTAGAQVRESDDLVHWRLLGNALDGVPEEAKVWSKASGLWAPEVIEVNGTYRMYYSASTFGSTRSCIGLATANSLTGPWEHQGLVVKTALDFATNNAIDANVITRNGKQWLCYGSFFDGIYLLELDPDTGFPLEKGSLGRRIAKRARSVEGAIEGPFIHYHPETDYYYLFVSFDSLAHSYNMRVFRSKEIEGPYLDMNGKEAILDTDENVQCGVKIAGSYQFSDEPPWIAPGHNSVFVENSKTWVIHHIRIQNEPHHCFGMVREMFWLPSGWPVLSPEYYASNQQSSALADHTIDGEWQIITLNTENTIQQATFVQWSQSDFIALEKENCYEKIDDASEIKLFTAYNWASKEEKWMFTGLSKEGFAIIGKKVR